MIKYLAIASLIIIFSLIFCNSMALAGSGISSSQNNLAKNKIEEIEAELKKIGWWSDKPIEPEKLNFSEAFGADKMAYNQWLQFVFIPRVKTIISDNGALPNQSQVGVKAMREWDYMNRVDKAQNLIKLLNEFDDICKNK